MSKIEPVSLTREEMIELRLNPDCPFCSERLPGHSVDVRYGDDRVVRMSNGNMTVHLGYYTPYQTLARELFARAIWKKLEERGGTSIMRFLSRE